MYPLVLPFHSNLFVLCKENILSYDSDNCSYENIFNVDIKILLGSYGQNMQRNILFRYAHCTNKLPMHL